jgi:hypothetical protein
MAEKRLIDKDKLLSAFEQEQYFRLSNNDIKAIIDSAPTIDAVAVTRCRECKFHNHENCVDPDDLYCLRKNRYMTRNDFCSYGKKKESEGK